MPVLPPDHPQCSLWLCKIKQTHPELLWSYYAAAWASARVHLPPSSARVRALTPHLRARALTPLPLPKQTAY